MPNFTLLFVKKQKLLSQRARNDGCPDFRGYSRRVEANSRQYGITGYGVSRPGIQNMKGFCIKINLSKGNY